MYPDARRRVVRVLGEMEAGEVYPDFETWRTMCAPRLAAKIRRSLTVREFLTRGAMRAGIAPFAPWYVYVAALLLLGWGSFLFYGSLSWDHGPELWGVMGLVVALYFVIGSNLLFRQRWVWFLGILASVFFIVLGLSRLSLGPDFLPSTIEAAFYLVPAAVILTCLLPTGARVAFLGPGSADAV